MKRLFKFLRDLEKNNNREWFSVHKDEYDYLKKEWEADVQKLITQMSVYDNSLLNLQAKDCIYRIYRDVRFSPNKAPYKTYFSAVIGAGGRKCIKSCYYLHVQPGGNSGLFGGIWCPEPTLLNALRHSIDDNVEEFEEILEAPEFSSLYKLVGNSLKTAPKGFAKNSPNIKYLRFKEYLLEHKLPDEYFYSNDWIEKSAKEFQPQLTFHKFLNFTIEEEL